MTGKRKHFPRFLPALPAILLSFVLLAAFPALAAPEDPGESPGQETAASAESEAFPLPGSIDEAELDRELEELLNSGDDTEITETIPELPAQDLEIEDDPERVLSYDRTARMYVYTAGEGIRYALSVPDGAVSTKTVRFDPGGGNVIRYMKDGVQIFPMEDSFTEPGRYEILLLGTNADQTVLSENAADAEGKLRAARMRIRFRIIPDLTGSVDSVDTPEDLRLASAELDGNRLLTAGRLNVDRDGEYRLLYTGLRDERIEYELRFRSDRTEPEIRFTKDVTGEREAFAPVSFSVPEPGVTVTVKRDGSDMVYTANTLTSGGSYNIIARDPAGNETVVSFYLRYSIRNQLIFLVILFAALSVAGGILLYRMRHAPRVL